MKIKLLFVVLIASSLLFFPVFRNHMLERPVEIKLGYVPHYRAVKLATAEFSPIFAELSIVKVLFYFGSLVDQWTKQVIIRPEFFNMFKTLQSAIMLDPYNMDAYYFLQASFTWELRRIEDVNTMLDHGMKYRTWDPWIPFYAGFNAGYFLHDYPVAAKYLQRAAEISKNPLFAKLAARYYYESDQTVLGLAFLDTMIAGAKDPAVKRTYEVRKQALLAVIDLEKAIAEYFDQTGEKVQHLETLVISGIIGSIPEDPYGGDFYIDEEGKIRSSSKFANPDL